MMVKEIARLSGDSNCMEAFDFNDRNAIRQGFLMSGLRALFLYEHGRHVLSIQRDLIHLR